jgi:hypothetical protein
MIARTSGFGMGLGSFSRPLKREGVLRMPDARLDTMGHVESLCVIPLGAGVLRLLGLGVAVGEIIDHRCVADRVEVTHCVISATRELFSEDEGVEL